MRGEKKVYMETKNMLLKNQQVDDEITGEIKKYFETNDSENITIQNLWDAAQALRCFCI